MNDLTQVWMCAVNCGLYETDEGPKLLNIASGLEPHMVSRAEAFRDLYARILLVDLDGDPARCAALGPVIEKKRRQAPSAWAAQTWRLSAELLGRVIALIAQAGADRDEAARRHLVAGARHSTQSVILGQLMPDYQRELDTELAAALADTGSEGGNQ
ncbi:MULTISPECIES: hypothetical protein [unclassified Mycobacteroides]|uniref:hypothetical protein n=1 Tax=unclassified Mycobacteroides TaxID=2618759 RepID=UPI00071638E6|nr:MULTISPECIES: hypothetical protein [unclassified Mycobacteroides]KRQ23341.1 hypothetical protein AOT91_23315 [Mycobacteroides sp. H092]KRQ23510.1 hypothetical protein AOT87_12575 [Mycobacteroides sp. H003]KRQ40319.1 hypothetical protein AOT92_15205 [Mycobacteroides sp. H101]KRQ47368.1 hypothetical protein AOT88_15715 [Mycobacteroides sp. H063]KRQ57767.1 hypothetical protein AOT90_25965 [Mycobacteroides sp. H079]